jgi:pimeloyl-ACP methyl ester carboxylesterase
LVGNDTGGALCQLTVAEHPERIGRLVLTNCDAFENFPPPKLRLAIRLLGAPGAVGVVSRLGRLRFVRRVSMAPLTVEPIPDSYPKNWLRALGNADVRRDLARVCRAISSDHTLAAASRFAAFEKPVLIAWGTGDRFFPRADAERLAAAFPDGRLEWIEDARTFVQMDAPERLGKLITEFVRPPASEQRPAPRPAQSGSVAPS